MESRRLRGGYHLNAICLAQRGVAPPTASVGSWFAETNGARRVRED